MSANGPGHNQPPPLENVNLFRADPMLDTATSGFPDAVRAGLSDFGAFWGAAETRDFADMANRSPPVLKRYDPRGNRLDEIDFHPAYHALMRRSIMAGLNCSVWEEGEAEAGLRYRARAVRFYLAAQTESGHLCPLTMTNAALASLSHQPDLAALWRPAIVSRAYDRSPKPLAAKRGALIGMGLTDKQGGTDLRANLTRAEPEEGGRYRITGHKWFLSAPASDAFVVLAQLPEGSTAFLMPRVLPDGAKNAIRFERLKDKLGNRSNATSEAEFDGALAWAIGEPGRGIPIVLDMATLARLDCSVASAGLMRAGFAEAVHHLRHRSAFGKPLVDQPLMTRVLADMALDLAAATALTLRLAEALDFAPHQPDQAAYARIVLPAAKYWVTKAAPVFLCEAMECLGGNGYVEENVLPRLYREAPVNAIWEGSGNAVALDVLRVVRRDPDLLGAALGLITGDLGGKAAVAVKVIDAAASVAVEDEGSARILAEQLALLAAAAALRRDYPAALADLFLETRLGRPWRTTYGMLDARADLRALIDYLCPE